MNFHHPQLVEHYGSWVRVLIAFYDFLLESSQELSPSEWTQASVEALSGGYADGKEFFETTVRCVEEKYTTQQQAWEQFLASHYDQEPTEA